MLAERSRNISNLIGSSWHFPRILVKRLNNAIKTDARRENPSAKVGLQDDSR